MDPGYRTPLLDYFRRGEVPKDVRLMAARGILVPRAHEQLGLLLLLIADSDPEVAGAAAATIDGLPRAALASFLARSDAPAELKAFFAARGIQPSTVADAFTDDTLSDAGSSSDNAEPVPDVQVVRLVSTLTVPEKLKLAMQGSREQRSVLIRDPNKLVALSVLSSPKLAETEIEAFSRMANVSEEVLRVIGTTRAWTRTYSVAANLVRNPKTPPAVSLTLLSRLTERDTKMLAVDRGVPEALRVAARKNLLKTRSA